MSDVEKLLRIIALCCDTTVDGLLEIGDADSGVTSILGDSMLSLVSSETFIAIVQRHLKGESRG